MLNMRLREGIIGGVQHSTSKFSSKSWLGSAVKLAYDKYGGKTSDERAATPLVILHGLFGQKRNWRSLAKQFQRLLNNTVFTLDLRNHGLSYSVFKLIFCINPVFCEHYYVMVHFTRVTGMTSFRCLDCGT